MANEVPESVSDQIAPAPLSKPELASVEKSAEAPALQEKKPPKKKKRKKEGEKKQRSPQIRKEKFVVSEYQAISLIVRFLNEEAWNELSNFLAAFVISSHFLESDPIKEKLKGVTKLNQKAVVRNHFRDELLSLLAPKLRF